MHDTFYSSSLASLASSAAGAAKCFSTKAAKSSMSLLPLYSSALRSYKLFHILIWYMDKSFLKNLFSILVNIESREAIDTMCAAELSIGIAVGCAVHVPNCHLSIVWKNGQVSTLWQKINVHTLVFLGKFLPGRCQPLTMATPLNWSCETIQACSSKSDTLFNIV